MKTIIDKIVERKAITLSQFAKAMFPNNMYPIEALDRLSERGDAKASQLSRANRLTKVVGFGQFYHIESEIDRGIWLQCEGYEVRIFCNSAQVFKNGNLVQRVEFDASDSVEYTLSTLLITLKQFKNDVKDCKDRA